MTTPPRFAALAAVAFAVGLGMTMYYGYALYRLPSYTPAQIAESAEGNLLLDYAREGRKPPETREQWQRELKLVQADVETAIVEERNAIVQPLTVGTVMSIASLWVLWQVRKSQRRS